MSEQSKLNDYVETQGLAGNHESVGQFTISLTESARKTALFLLEEPGDWAVKIIQAVVATGAKQPIQISLSRTNSVYRFVFGKRPPLSEIREFLLSQQRSESAALNHLIVGLSVLLGSGRKFKLQYLGESCRLVWDGESLEEASCEPELKSDRLIVSNLTRSESDLGFWARLRLGRRRTAEMLESLQGRCYVCPLPLSVDSRRLDAIQLSPQNGWGSGHTIPILLGEGSGGALPSLLTPPGTFEGVDKTKMLFDMWSSRPMSDQIHDEICPQAEPSWSFLLSLHIDSIQKTGAVLFREVPSTCCWVLDGAVISQEPFEINGGGCALAVFLSAEGLDFDISGFGLRNGDEKARRKAIITRLVAEKFEDVEKIEFQKFQKLTLLESAGYFLLANAGAIVMSGGVVFGAPLCLAGMGLGKKRADWRVRVGKRAEYVARGFLWRWGRRYLEPEDSH